MVDELSSCSFAGAHPHQTAVIVGEATRLNARKAATRMAKVAGGGQIHGKDGGVGTIFGINMMKVYDLPVINRH